MTPSVPGMYNWRMGQSLVGRACVSIDDVYDQIAEFGRAHGARRVILFGSRARGSSFPKSDIDLAVEGCPDFAGLYDDLQEGLWSLLEVDVINLDDSISDELRTEIDRDGKVLYEAL